MKHYFYFLLLFNYSCSQAVFKSIDEGLMYWKIYFINTNPKEPVPFEYIGGKIWFKDSCFILERKTLVSNDYYSPKGNIHSQEDISYKFTFLDLRNMHCQDYLSLQDTSTIFCNYFLNPAQKENLDNRFYGKIVPYFVPDTTFELTDTIIKGENFKRVQLNFHKEDYSHSYIYYLSCNSYKTKFHINTELDEKYPHCQSVKEEVIVANGPHSMKEFSLLEDKLSEKMNKIFFTWEQNAKNTKMPLLNLNDAKIQCDLPLRDSLFNPK